MAHSAKTLSKKSMDRAKSIQSATSRGDSAYESLESQREPRVREGRSEVEDGRGSCMKSTGGASTKSVSMLTGARPPVAPSRPTTAKSRATSVKSGTHTMVSVAGFQVGRGDDDDSDMIEEEEGERQRRVSWAFQHPNIPKTKELNLNETKSLLRSQIRARGDVIPPDFIYLTVNAIQASMKSSELSKHMEANRRDQELARTKQLGRPSSSPSRIDPRTRLPLQDLGMDTLMFERGLIPAGASDAHSVAESRVSRFTQSSKRTTQPAETGPVVATKAVYVRDFNVTSLQPADKKFVSVHAQNLKSSIPKGQLMRPHTASAAVPSHGMNAVTPQPPRSKSVGYGSRPFTAKTAMSSITSSSLAPSSPRKKKYHGFSTSATEPVMVPMLMYSKDVSTNAQRLKAQRKERMCQPSTPTGMNQPVIGAVSDYTNPFRAKTTFQLRTHEQIAQEVVTINRNHVEQQKQLREDQERRQKQLWLNKVKSQLKRDKDTDGAKPLKKVVKKG